MPTDRYTAFQSHKFKNSQLVEKGHHSVTFFDKLGGASKEAPLMREYTMLSIGEQLVLETYKGMGSTFKIQC